MAGGGCGAGEPDSISQRDRRREHAPGPLGAAVVPARRVEPRAPLAGAACSAATGSGQAEPVRRELARRARRLRRPPGLGVLRHTTPLSEAWGSDRGTPVDRYYIEQFLDRHREDIRGRMLEVRDSRYTSRFGSGVTAADVLDV